MPTKAGISTVYSRTNLMLSCVEHGKKKYNLYCMPEEAMNSLLALEANNLRLCCG